MRIYAQEEMEEAARWVMYKTRPRCSTWYIRAVFFSRLSLFFSRINSQLLVFLFPLSFSFPFLFVCLLLQPRIEYLDISGLSGSITAEAIVAAVPNAAIISTLKFEDDYHFQTQQRVTPLLSAFANLVTLSFSVSSQFAPSNFKIVATMMKLEKLSMTLNCSGDTAPTDADLEQVMKACPLRFLYLRRFGSPIPLVWAALAAKGTLAELELSFQRLYYYVGVANADGDKPLGSSLAMIQIPSLKAINIAVDTM